MKTICEIDNHNFYIENRKDKKWRKRIEGILTDWCEDWFSRTFNLNLEINIKLNYRLTRMLGYFEYNSDSLEKRIFLGGLQASISFYLYGDDLAKDTVIQQTLKHEMCHYYLYITHQNYADGHKDFENLIYSLGIESSGTTEHMDDNFIENTSYNIYGKVKRVHTDGIEVYYPFDYLSTEIPFAKPYDRYLGYSEHYLSNYDYWECLCEYIVVI